MKLSETVEWAAHACVVLAALPSDRALSGAALATFYDLPPAYMAKTLQSLARAGLVTAVRGVNGGYRLARPATEISLWQVRAAITGEGPQFRCADIRNRGPCAPEQRGAGACSVASAFWQAEAAYKEVLDRATIADLAVRTARQVAPADLNRFTQWLDAN